ncbi:hypothetical protein FRC01_001326, partial [Tulasnella sp. 417]
AGLFAGVNSAFLALTLPLMSADPTGDTNALLLQLIKGENATIKSEADLPSATFSPLPAIYPVNMLFAVSLTFALMSSFSAKMARVLPKAREETDDDLIVASVKRVILTSEHRAALVHAATNICAIDDEDSLRQLLDDTEFFSRLHSLYSAFYKSRYDLPDQLWTTADATAKAFAAAILHLALSVGTILDLVSPEGRLVDIKDSPQAPPVLSYDRVHSFSAIAGDAALNSQLADGDMKHVSPLRLFGIVLKGLFYGPFNRDLERQMRSTIENLANFTTSYQLIHSLPCAVQLYALSRQNNHDRQAGRPFEHLPQMFELVQTAYKDYTKWLNYSRKSTWIAPFLSGVLHLSSESRDRETRDRSDVYKICLDVFRHACEFDGYHLPIVFASMGRMMRDIELDVRHPALPEQDRAELRRRKDQYIGIILHKMDSNRLEFYHRDLSESLGETLQYIQDVAAPQEPGHHENRVTLELFKLVRAKFQQPDYPFQFWDFDNAYDEFEAWVDMGDHGKQRAQSTVIQRVPRGVPSQPHREFRTLASTYLSLMNGTANIFEQPITERPEIPIWFGEDGGKFYYYYDQLADDTHASHDERQAADDTNALVLQLVKGGNVTINSEADLPSATFSPPPAIYTVNVLFAVSLACALMSSFLAVLGQQWLVYYLKRSGGGAERQRKEQLRRQLGAQRWRLELVLDDILPDLLQVGLIIFCISFILYLRTLSGPMSFIISGIVGTALAIAVGAAIK